MEKDKEISPISILLTAPFPALREGLKALVESDGSVVVSAVSASPYEWGSHFHDIEAVLLAPLGPLTVDWIQKFLAKSPEKPILLLVSQTLEELPDFGKSIWGVLPFSATSQDIILAIHALVQGLWIASPAVIPSPKKSTSPIMPDYDTGPTEPLTDREIEVLQCLALGYTNKEAAMRLGISVQTIKFHVSSIFSKLGVTNRTEAVSAGVRLGWVTL